MADTFTLTVPYKGKEMEFEGELRILGYTYKIAMQVQGAEVLLEPDEEGKLRVALSNLEDRKMNWDRDLLAAIAHQLESLFNKDS